MADWRNGQFKYAGDGVAVGAVMVATAPGETSAKYVDVNDAGELQLMHLLVSRSGVQRMEAQREILERGPMDILEQGLLNAAKHQPTPLYGRVAALFTFKQLLGEFSHPGIETLLEDDSIREFALRALADRRGELSNVSTKPFIDALEDENPRVVLQALIGLERLGKPHVAEHILAASPQWQEASVSPRIKHTAVTTLASLGNVAACLDALSSIDTRALALQALQRMHQVEAVNGLIDVVQTTEDADLRFDALLALARLHYKEKPWDLVSWWGTRPDDRGPYFEMVEWFLSKRIRAVLEEGFEAIAEARQGSYLEGLAKNRIPVSELKLQGLDPVLAALGSIVPNDAEVQLLTGAAQDLSRTWNQRLECYRALQRESETPRVDAQIEVLASWMDQATRPEGTDQHVDGFVNDVQRGLELRVLRKIAANGGDTESRIAWRALLTMLFSPLAKEQWVAAVQKFVAENPREVGFFLALADLKLSGFEEQIQVGLNSDNDDLIQAAEKAQAEVATTVSGGPKVVEVSIAEAFNTAMEQRGDPEFGKQLFSRVGCLACHAVDMDAEQKGPFLGTAGSKFTRDYLIDSVLDPNKVVAQGFQTSLFTMKDGSARLGFVTAEADGVVTVRDIAGQASQFNRSDVAKEDHLPNSLMPPGLASGLTIGEFTSLIDYLVSLKGE